MPSRPAEIDVAHGSGGRAMAQLIEELFAKLPRQRIPGPRRRWRTVAAPARGPAGDERPIRTSSPACSFPGGDIGCLSVHGTINDVAVMGAEPLYLSAGFIAGRGLKLADLARIVQSMAAAARRQGCRS